MYISVSCTLQGVWLLSLHPITTSMPISFSSNAQHRHKQGSNDSQKRVLENL
jgi:hypothetical protein